MKLIFVMILAILASCSMVPKKYPQDVEQERNTVLSTALPKFQECFAPGQGEILVQLKFRLFSVEAPFLVRPRKVAFDPRTNQDQILVEVRSLKDRRKEEVACLKSVLKKLEFNSVNPAYEYMVSHEFEMKLGAPEVAGTAVPASI